VGRPIDSPTIRLQLVDATDEGTWLRWIIEAFDTGRNRESIVKDLLQSNLEILSERRSLGASLLNLIARSGQHIGGVADPGHCEPRHHLLSDAENLVEDAVSRTP